MKTSEPQRKNMTALGTEIASNSILKEIDNGCQQNLVLSPLLLHIALNMLASASTGRTLKQLLQFLESESIADLNAQSSLFAELATSGGGGGPIISLANGIWVNDGFPLKPSFKQLVEDVYKAKSESFDFVNQGEQVRGEINSWAKEASNGHIYPLLPRGFFTKDAIALLASAIYFKGIWTQKFDASNTKDEDFHLLNGQTIKVPFMKKSNTRQLYRSFESFKLLQMEYKNGQSDDKNYDMYIFLPHKKDGLQELVEKFRADPRFLLENREVSKVLLNELQLPKMKYEYELNVKKTMEEVGLDLLFDEKKAEITEMVETCEVIYLSKAIQKSYIEVDEEGTIATAINIFSLCGCPRSRPKPPPPQHSFVADHPFLFMIKEEVSDIIVFIRAALNPNLEGGAGNKRKRKATKMKKQKDGKKKQS
ncbi:serpin-ZXA-like [Euphorbia lathyris]|uniref:serpin-ZXA-like n=1 Tax=Euphorbia lathyris TaxID=212925 RepID=UPI003314434B